MIELTVRMEAMGLRVPLPAARAVAQKFGFNFECAVTECESQVS